MGLKRWIAALLAALLSLSALTLAEEAAPEAADGVEPTEAPAETEQPVWTLTVRYLYADRTEARPAQQLALAEDAAYDVEPPQVDGYVPDPERVKGEMPGADWTVEVIYRAVSTEVPSEPGAPGEPAESPEPDASAGPQETGEPTESPGPDASAGPEEPVEPAESPGPGASAGPEEPAASTEPGAGWTLTIRYVLPNGEAAAADYIQPGMTAGQTYDVESPAIEGLTADQPRVSGAMGEADRTIIVTYRAAGGFPGGFPGGGHGGGRPGGAEMEPPEDSSFQVTPGEAFTHIHTSGDKDDSLYGALEPSDETVRALSLSLTTDGVEQPFSAEWAEGALILSGEAGQWNLGGDALRALYASGTEALVLVSGDFAVALPTGGFVSGYAYDCLLAQGLPSASFTYAVDPAARTVRLTAQETTYELAEAGGDMRLTGAAFGDPAALRALYVQEDE